MLTISGNSSRRGESGGGWCAVSWLVLVASVGLFGASCSTPNATVVVSVPEQRMVVLDDEQKPVATYPVSTSKFGLGDDRGSYRTPLGKFEIAAKIGDGVPVGGVMKARRYTGEVLPVDAPGRDPIVTRILWLKGKERSNSNAYGRYIYIHGTPEERNIGRPASYGCVRMRSCDVLDLYHRVPKGSEVVILNSKLPKATRKLLEPREPEAPLAPQGSHPEPPMVAAASEPHRQPAAAPPVPVPTTASAAGATQPPPPPDPPQIAAASEPQSSPSWHLSLKEAAAIFRR